MRLHDIPLSPAGFNNQHQATRTNVHLPVVKPAAGIAGDDAATVRIAPAVRNDVERGRGVLTQSAAGARATGPARPAGGYERAAQRDPRLGRAAHPRPDRRLQQHPGSRDHHRRPGDGPTSAARSCLPRRLLPLRRRPRPADLRTARHPPPASPAPSSGDAPKQPPGRDRPGDDTVVEQFTVSGTHTGELPGVPPTGRTITLRGINIFRVHGEHIVERRGRLDELSLMCRAQAGVHRLKWRETNESKIIVTLSTPWACQRRPAFTRRRQGKHRVRISPGIDIPRPVTRYTKPPVGQPPKPAGHPGAGSPLR
jgi:hypothetical protein